MGTVSQLGQSLATLKLQLAVEDFQNLGVTPWFSYTVTLPERPIPSLSDRPHIKTPRLIVRPIISDDLEGFFQLRSVAEVQRHSKIRGRPDKSKDETSQHITAFEQDDQGHWYFGAFLQSTGELIGEGGLPDCQHMFTSASGWPEAEFFIKPEYWRQGYGTEFFNAVMDSWWDLPREKRRHQLIPAVAPTLEPGDPVPEGAVFQWEDGNDAARSFFAKVLAQAPVGAEGGFESIDTREGREGNLVRWTGTLVTNPRPVNLEEE
ncbi:Ff.00g015730.m01.CDS01 [Fusarium sp. VM40]|nr:Ff.00g015730.m01.CDS01 [Fusarium sp. VM40]